MVLTRHNNRRTACVADTGTGDGAIILLYHRVTALEFDPQLLAVSPRHFAEHLEVLKQWTHLASLGDLVEGGQEFCPPGRSFTITFDDGYADNVEQALPLLQAAGVPATFFVVSGYVDGEREFWWDELERILFETEHLPVHLSLEVADGQYAFHSSDEAGYATEEREPHCAWNVLETHDPTERHRLYRELFARLRPMRHEQRREVLDTLLGWARQEPLVRPTHRVLSAGQLAALAGSKLADVGSHTVTHPVLSGLSVEEQCSEIRQSKAQLEALTGRSVTAFSYPFGTRHDYTEETAAIVKEAGFGMACANRRGLVRPGTDIFQLPRVLVRDWDGDTLLRHLREACLVG